MSILCWFSLCFPRIFADIWNRVQQMRATLRCICSYFQLPHKFNFWIGPWSPIGNEAGYLLKKRFIFKPIHRLLCGTGLVGKWCSDANPATSETSKSEYGDVNGQIKLRSVSKSRDDIAKHGHLRVFHCSDVTFRIVAHSKQMKNTNIR